MAMAIVDVGMAMLVGLQRLLQIYTIVLYPVSVGCHVGEMWPDVHMSSIEMLEAGTGKLKLELGNCTSSYPCYTVSLVK